jgi:hypothetical protein
MFGTMFINGEEKKIEKRIRRPAGANPSRKRTREQK